MPEWVSVLTAFSAGVLIATTMCDWRQHSYRCGRCKEQL